MKYPLILLAFCIGIFLFLKIGSTSIRLSDTNIYFATAHAILQGKLLYRDIFFTNLPLFPLISALYLFLSKQNILFYYFTAPLEASLVCFFIYKIIVQQTAKPAIALLTSILYLFSFTVLSTTDHQTGVFLASLFAVASYYWYLKNNYILTGICVALMILAKAYFLPVLLTYCVVLLMKLKRKSIPFFLSFSITSLIILLPFLMYSGNDFIKDVLHYSLTRSQGLNKSGLILFFITHDILLFILIIINLLFLSKKTFFSIFSLIGIIFFFSYKDTYFLYLNYLIPFVCLSVGPLYNYFSPRISISIPLITTLLGVAVLYNFITYTATFRTLQQIDNITDIVTTITTQHPTVLYGTNDLTPILSFLTKVPQLHNIIDTNANIFRKGYLNNNVLTKDAIKQKAILITHGAYYPVFGIQESLDNEIFDKALVEKNCHIIKTVPIKTEGMVNQLIFWKCF